MVISAQAIAIVLAAMILESATHQRAASGAHVVINDDVNSMSSALPHPSDTGNQVVTYDTPSSQQPQSGHRQAPTGSLTGFGQIPVVAGRPELGYRQLYESNLFVSLPNDGVCCLIVVHPVC